MSYQARYRMSTWRIDGLPSYHAISYTWGDSDSNTVILINDRTFRVRTNCEAALKQAWWYKNNGYYWIDAICINQVNDEEKGQQVAMMGKIYKTAYNVLACVGDHADDSLFLYRHLASTNEFLQNLHSLDNTRDLLRQTHKLLTVRRYLRAAVHFAKRSYFSRLWIVQELKSARKAKVLCGADTLPKPTIYRMFRDLDESLIFRSRGRTRMHRLAQWTLRAVLYRVSTYDDRLSDQIYTATFVTDDILSTTFLLFQSGFLHCTQVRDRIYGMMSIIDWGEITPPTPDYTKSDFEVALDCVTPMLELLRGEGELELVDVCSHIAHALEISVHSDCVSVALQARRGARGSDVAGFSMPVGPPSTQLQSEAVGWRLSGEHFIRRHQFTFSEWKVPNSTKGTVILPDWVREGDWILALNPFYRVRDYFLVLRDVVDGLYSPILGQGFLSSRLLVIQAPADATFAIFWDIEDLLVLIILGDKFDNSHVEFDVCKRESPGSSYAIRQK